MRYLLTIHHDESVKAPDAERQKVFAAYGAYTQELKKAGVMLGGEPLHPTSTGARITVRNGKKSVIDGPFTETKEVLGGYYLLDVKSKEEAIEWGSKCPGAQYGTIEVVQVMDM